MKKMKKSDLIFLIIAICVVLILCPLLIFRTKIFNKNKSKNAKVTNSSEDTDDWYKALEENYHYDANNQVVDYNQMTPPEIIAFELSVRYGLDFTVDDVKIWNMDRVDGFPIYQAEVYSKEHDNIFYAFYYTGTLKVTDDYARFQFADKMNERMNAVFDGIGFGDELTKHYVSYGLTTIVFNDDEYDEYVKNSDSFISITFDFDKETGISVQDIQRIKDLCKGLESENFYYTLHIHLGEESYSIYRDRSIDTPYEDQIEAFGLKFTEPEALYDENTVLEILGNGYKPPYYCELDHIDDYGNFVFHIYESVDNGSEAHNATIDWITVNPYTGRCTNFYNKSFNITEYEDIKDTLYE